MYDLDGADWRKSSFSGSVGQCVEVAGLGLGDGTAVRDSKDPNGPKLIFTPEEWTAFVAGVKNGEFDPK